MNIVTLLAILSSIYITNAFKKLFEDEKPDRLIEIIFNTKKPPTSQDKVISMNSTRDFTTVATTIVSKVTKKNIKLSSTTNLPKTTSKVIKTKPTTIKTTKYIPTIVTKKPSKMTSVSECMMKKHPMDMHLCLLFENFLKKMTTKVGINGNSAIIKSRTTSSPPIITKPPRSKLSEIKVPPFSISLPISIATNSSSRFKDIKVSLKILFNFI
uniref:Zonadhesin n=1 Tax=Parastrongyloides trichosuri TaxID=131310 RepID=A0A0N4ZR54_PARTI